MTPESKLATTLGQLQDKTVANLGHSGYGPQQELVVLRIEFGLSWQEIALEVGGSVDAVRMTVTRALQRMAEAIGEEHRDGH